MAGGSGTRLRPLTCDLPKPMVPILNRPIAEHIVNLLKRHGFTVYNVPGSYKAWTSAGYPVEKPKAAGRGTDTERS